MKGRALKFYRQAADDANSGMPGMKPNTGMRGLQLLQLLPEDSERMEHEMGLQIALRHCANVRPRTGSDEVKPRFCRAHELFQLSGKSPDPARRRFSSPHYAVFGLSLGSGGICGGTRVGGKTIAAGRG